MTRDAEKDVVATRARMEADDERTKDLRGAVADLHIHAMLVDKEPTEELLNAARRYRDINKRWR